MVGPIIIIIIILLSYYLGIDLYIMFLKSFCC